MKTNIQVQQEHNRTFPFIRKPDRLTKSDSTIFVGRDCTSYCIVMNSIFPVGPLDSSI